jgi:hypothetical protein
LTDYARTIFLQGMAEKITRRISENVARLAYVRFDLGEFLIDEDEFVADALIRALGEDSGCVEPEELTGENCELLFVEETLLQLAAHPQGRIHDFWNAQAEWSRATFGSDAERGPIGPLKHLCKEAKEALDSEGRDPVEIADCLFLVFDAARRSGLTLDGLIEVCEKKLAVNKSRTWSKPTSDEPVEHDRSGEGEALRG